MIMKAKNVIIVLPPHFHGHLSKSTVIKVLIFEQSYKGNIKTVSYTHLRAHET